MTKELRTKLKKEMQSDGKLHYNVVWDKVFSFPIGWWYDGRWDEYLVKLLEREDALKMVAFIETLLEQEIIEAERRMKERCLECVPLWMTYYDDLTQKDYRDWYNQWVDDSRTAISSLK